MIGSLAIGRAAVSAAILLALPPPLAHLGALFGSQALEVSAALLGRHVADALAAGWARGWRCASALVLRRGGRGRGSRRRRRLTGRCGRRRPGLGLIARGSGLGLVAVAAAAIASLPVRAIALPVALVLHLARREPRGDHLLPLAQVAA